MDTRPYRLNWPRLSVVYDLSPERVFKLGTKRLKGGILPGTYGGHMIGLGHKYLFIESNETAMSQQILTQTQPVDLDMGANGLTLPNY